MSDQDDKDARRDDKADAKERGLQGPATAPPPPLFDPENSDDMTIVAPRPSRPDGLAQMFSREAPPGPPRRATNDEGDALLDMLFEDAKAGAVDEEPADEATIALDPPPPARAAAPAPPAAPPRRPPPPPRPRSAVASSPDPAATPAAPEALTTVGEAADDMPPLLADQPTAGAPSEDSIDVSQSAAFDDVDDAELEEEPSAEAAPAPRAISQASIPPRAPAALTFESEEDAAAQLARSDRRDAWAERAAWLREEALEQTDRAVRGRSMLVVSELLAMAGDEAGASSAAIESRELAPNGALSHRQIRGLLAREAAWEQVLDVLEGEGKSVSTPPARAHIALLGAEIARVALRDQDQARRRLELALRILPSDPRPHTHRLAASLADADAGEGAATLQKTRFPDAAELAPLSKAHGTLLAHRGLAPKTRHPATPYESLLRARAEFEAGQPVAATQQLAGAQADASLVSGFGWLVAALGAARKETRPRAVEALRGLLDGSHGALARRSLAARAIELGDAAAAKSAIETEDSEAFSAADRVALTALSGGAKEDITAWHEPLWNDEELTPIAAAVDAALDVPSADRLPRGVGAAAARAAVSLGRALASTSATQVESALGVFIDSMPEAGGASPYGGIDRALGMELDAEAKAGGRLARAVTGWRDDGANERERLLAGALIAEISGEVDRAQEDYERARTADPTLEAAMRARLSSVTGAEAAALLSDHANALEPGARAALLMTESALRSPDDDAADAPLQRAAELDPRLPFPPHLGERSARSRGDRDALVAWLRVRREASDDTIEQAHDLVREALLLSDADGSPAVGLLEQALRSRAGDVGLRELYERLATEPPADRAAWRLAQASAASGHDSARLALEAAFEFERTKEWAKVAEAANLAQSSGEADLAPILLYRAALAGEGTGEIIDALMPKARETEDRHVRREIYERLAELDERGRRDAASGLLWRRTILEESPEHLPTLRRLASALVSAGRDDELEPVALDIARALGGPESVAHAMLASRLRIRATGWDDTRPAVDVAYKHHPRTIWALRQMEAHARAKGEDELALEVDRQLIERTQRASEAATLALRGAESATRAGLADEALALLSHAIEIVPNHLVAHLQLAMGLEATGNAAGAAASLEAAAAASHAGRADDLYRAALLWQDKVGDPGRARRALEQVAEIDPSYGDVFERLQAIYVATGSRAELAALLKRRLDAVTDPQERVEMEVLRGRALADVGDAASAKRALAAALEANPDHVDALSVFADVAAAESDWSGAEQAWIRLARLVSDPARQAEIYMRLGELYDEHLPNPERAELSYNEILKRLPDDGRARERLVQLFQKTGDHPRALEQQTILINAAQSPEEKCQRTTELARIHELAGDVKKAEATLLQARKTWPKDDGALAALARFYHRNNQVSAAQVLLDRAVADARRALSTGRFEAYLFTTIATVAALRNRPDASRVAQAAVAALEGNQADVDGVGARAGDPHLDDLLAPDVMNPAFRELLRRTGQLLDAAMPFDLTSIRATPLPPQQRDLNDLVRALGQTYGFPAMNVYTSSALGQVCIPVSANPPAVVLGQALATNAREDVRGFLVHRALKILQTNGSALSRTAPIDLWPLLAAYLKALNPSWSPQGVDQGKLTEFYGRISRSMQSAPDPQLAAMATEVIGTIGNRASTLNTIINGWGNRAALLATGDLNIGMVAIAWSGGHAAGPPGVGKERVTWIGRNAEARELVVFAVSDAYADARSQLGLAR